MRRLKQDEAGKEKMNEILRNIAPLFKGMDKRVHAFRRDTYGELFKGYLDENKAFFSELNRALAAGEEGDLSYELPSVIAGYVKEELEQISGKRKREAAQLDYNMFMAVYFLPAILECKQESARMLAGCICAIWGETFKGNRIQWADHASIVSGFRTKLCYITTAVCQSLQKPEDCHELELLRGYRDGYLLQNGKAALVEEYYNIAPTIVRRIEKLPDAKEKYLYIWERYLKPCVEAIENGELEVCGAVYTEMVEELRQQFLVTAAMKTKK